MTILDDIKFWMQVVDDSKRIIYCRPELTVRLRAEVILRGWDSFLTVEPTKNLPIGTDMILINPGAIEASFNKLMQRAHYR